MTRFVLDRSLRRAGEGRVLIGGSPLTVMTLTDGGAGIVDRVAAGDDLVASGKQQLLLDRLIDTGMIHPAPAPPGIMLAFSVVIPAHRPALSPLTDLVAACRRAGALDVIVVDDASPDLVPELSGATVIRHDTNQGPGAARMTGLDVVTTPLVVFVDVDVVLPHGWLQPLLAHFDDDRVALVAPRVAVVGGHTVLNRYEQLHSPLDLGDQPARIQAGTRISYVPSAAMVVRVDRLREVDGFDTSMRVGEDVDLVWRLAAAGHRLRYEPAVPVHHQPRPGWIAWIRQRHDYGSSAAPLARRHPDAIAPVRVSGWSAAAWAAAVLGWPAVGAALATGTTMALARKLRLVPDGPTQALRLAGLGNLFAGRALAGAVTRAWWPLALLGALCSRRIRRAVALATVAPPLYDWIRRRPPIDPPRYVALRIVDDLAYGAGLVRGVLTERSAAAMRPDFSSWPQRSRSGAASERAADQLLRHRSISHRLGAERPLAEPRRSEPLPSGPYGSSPPRS